jgi:FkbM family methyltransferase
VARLFERLPRTLRRHRLMTAWMRLTGEDALQLVRIRDSSFGYADMSDGFVRLMVIDADFEPDFFRLADAVLAKGGVFLDVGANHGLLSFGLAGRHGAAIDFHLFEPSLKLVSSIEKSRALYPEMRCKVNATALSDHVGAVLFAFEAAQTGISHVVSEGGESVPATTLDRYLDEAQIDRVDFLKIDVEGYELHVLRGAHKSLGAQKIQVIYFEYMQKLAARFHPLSDLLNYLDGLGYQTCVCRNYDIGLRGSPTHTIRDGMPGAGLRLIPLIGFEPLLGTDLLAVPRENLAALAPK